MVNAERRGKRQVLIRPSSKVVVKFLSVMQKHGEYSRRGWQRHAGGRWGAQTGIITVGLSGSCRYQSSSLRFRDMNATGAVRGADCAVCGV